MVAGSHTEKALFFNFFGVFLYMDFLETFFFFFFWYESIFEWRKGKCLSLWVLWKEQRKRRGSFLLTPCLDGCLRCIVSSLVSFKYNVYWLILNYKYQWKFSFCLMTYGVNFFHIVFILSFYNVSTKFYFFTMLYNNKELLYLLK